ncbi:UDP-N-acetylmuramoyl-tripeptide--D-alanyl-D-alanine ligase [Terrilactibacillus sp. BCM23-1]|uniref:UDP-N-acetylmuramoyl-tripeptide--D-alanyl-D-alanine ligase n=1 Tax=Terrilactibacillus tamarindi TaxID=2599694 RepID=A0A6N8CPC1_9BACI|nr:UDP-N-acetylmuramoyl-tripeptide--D-alanyl-D-alanine ligase [Terrilactibacillus tamarindi]MTT32014.1 UDP-N-acetylmuramoyl-tripeptide--D-alanyl-D-alanine ligase [Terrilactibacillus tamarindi]
MSIQVSSVRHHAIRTRGTIDDTCQLTVFTDSRKNCPSGLFIPIQGENFDGHAFIDSAIKNGAKATLWSESVPLPDRLPLDFPVFFVKDTLKAMQDIAKDVLSQRNPIVIAVTGSNGKTSTKDIIESIIKTNYHTYKTQGNFNNHIGLPLTILSMPEKCEALILEMGMNHFGEISLLTQIARPDIAVITNIGESHIEFLGSREGIAKAKLEIVEGIKPGGTLIIDGDEPLLTQVKLDQCQVVTCGYNKGNTLQIVQVKPDISGYDFSLSGSKSTYHIPIMGKHNVKNAVYGVAVAKQLNIHEVDVKKGLEKCKLTKMRFESVEGKEGTLLINDSYNASPTSMKAVINTLKQLPNFKKRVVVLGDMYELGPDEENLHRSVADAIDPPISHVITIGPKGKWISDSLIEQGKPCYVQSFLTKKEALPVLETLLDKTTVILFKASRAAELEELVEALREKKGVKE